MKTQHTSGPWRTVVASAHEFNPNTRRRDIIGKCEFGDAYVAGDISEIDARLISAAPDLLSAVDSCLEIMIRATGERLPINRGTECEETDWQTAIRKARSAIAKAEGRAE